MPEKLALSADQFDGSGSRSIDRSRRVDQFKSGKLNTLMGMLLLVVQKRVFKEGGAAFRKRNVCTCVQDVRGGLCVQLKVHNMQRSTCG